MRIHHLGFAVLLGPLSLAACESNPPLGPEGDHEHELFVELTLSSSHVHTLAPLTFTVSVTDDHGDVVTDFEVLKVERLAVGSDTWRGTELTLNGTVYEGNYTFATSGEYMLRVVGMRHGETQESVLYEMAEAIHAVRAHVEAGGVRVEFESFPGHLHEGDVATMKFWIMEQERNDDGIRPLIPGIQATVVCNDAEGGVEEHVALEEADGIYIAEHLFDAVGDFGAEIRFPGLDGEEATAVFVTHVVHQH